MINSVWFDLKYFIKSASIEENVMVTHKLLLGAPTLFVYMPLAVTIGSATVQ